MLQAFFNISFSDLQVKGGYRIFCRKFNKTPVIIQKNDSLHRYLTVMIQRLGKPLQSLPSSKKAFNNVKFILLGQHTDIHKYCFKQWKYPIVCFLFCSNMWSCFSSDINLSFRYHLSGVVNIPVIRLRNRSL